MVKPLPPLKSRIQQKIMKPLEIIIAGLILLSVLSFAVETLPNKGPLLISMLSWADTTFLVVFSVEYLLRFCWQRKKPIIYLAFMALSI